MHHYGRPSSWGGGGADATNGWNVLAQRSADSTASHRFGKRSMSTRNIVMIVVIAILALTIGVALVTYSHCRSRRRQRQGQSKPTSGRNAGPWDRVLGFFRAGPGYHETSMEDDGGAEGGRASHQLGNTANGNTRNGSAQAQTNNTNGTVDRNTSVRSVMTLPAYRQMAGNNEQVLGREGDRDGIDVIVDLPTAEEEEALREQEMAALYHIRETRRQQIADREERRRLRSEAQERNDTAALREVQSRTRAASNDTRVNDLRSEVDRIKENRNRSVTSVSYADLGVARHDGTRIRANSNESERMGLLSDAASIAASTRSQAGHVRDQSRGSVVSLTQSVSASSPGNRNSGGSPPRLGSYYGRAGSSPELIEHEHADADATAPPPEYEDISLDDNDHLNDNTHGAELRRSTTPNEPPPEYTGPHRADSQDSVWRRQQQSEEGGGGGGESAAPNETSATPTTIRGVGGSPQLPSLRISQLPSIVVEPSSAQPRDNSETTEGGHSQA